MSLANNIKRLRKEKGLIQMEVDSKMWLGISHYSMIENGQRKASVVLLAKMAKFYGIIIDQIVQMVKRFPQRLL
jgi:transcriptional regulator with XRE-family HTH domain